ncbi:hypothetical protein LEP1GSC088_4481 [Leptospira interrogans str. L1207]|uniref:Uncharacterized protein n=1 Tax=Leptospira interrogans str. 2006001854 TaxID=1001590 RepID=M6GUH6_LEPIR|nr:hypothetical protein LEP1GSC037_1814 [Leptospira interrogans str. 2006001854]EMN51347.1 hypothetical protein LEP1GSC088_4481 [Leptospira interrogans str. L1207]
MFGDFYTIGIHFIEVFLFKTNIRRNLWAEKKSLSIFKILKVISV